MELKALTDDKLIKLYVKGDESCLVILLERYQEKIYSYIMLLVRDRSRADDIFQEAFYKVITSLKSGKYTDEGHFCAWVKCICRNIVIDETRMDDKMPTISHVKGKKDEEDRDIFQVLRLVEDNNPMTQMQEGERKSRLRYEMKFLLNQLPAQQKEVVILRYNFELSFNEISNLLGINLNTALGRMHYATNNLRKLAIKHGMLGLAGKQTAG